ncbi:MAG: alpha/beta fold hydrolase [Nitrososphaeria archaeon]
MTIYVLVHGAWHGGWCWRKLTPLLRSRGDEVYTLTFTGLGDRCHLLSQGINLDTHILDVVNCLEYEDLRDVVLVGHSYAGMVITGVAEKVPSRLRHLVYVDAFLPEDGESISDLHPHFVEKLRQIACKRGKGWLVPFPEEVINPRGGPLYGIQDADELRWLKERLKPHPLACFEQKVHVSNPEAVKLSKSFVWCFIRQGVRADNWGFFREARKAKELGWKVYEVESDHDVMVTAPEVLSNVLNEIR